MEWLELSPDQEAKAEHLEEILLERMRVEAQLITRLMASKENSELF